jgi:peptidoglycan/xylan/chitin deacetylase (PgdA/CDA1 family)
MTPPSASRRQFLRQLAAAGIASPLLSARTFAAPGQAPPPASGAPILVTLWFDTEDYILPEDDDATLRLATMLTDLGVKATFKVVGEKARVLEQRGRSDVIAALGKHDIGYHSNTHSQQPTVAVYLQHAGWEDGIEEFLRREAQGARDVERIFGTQPLAYGQPGSSWAPQAYPALRRMGIPLYLDEADQVGLDDQPFYYGGLLNVFRMRSTVTRMELAGGESLATGKAAFTTLADTLRAKGGGTISIYYHPNEWVHTEFWDAVNFSRGANPPRSAWRRPATRPASETARAFADFEQYIRFVQAQPGVAFVPASGMLQRYADDAPSRACTPADVRELARGCASDIGFVVRDGRTLSAGEVFSILTTAILDYARDGRWPDATSPRALDGPSRAYAAALGRSTAGAAIPWEPYARALADAVAVSQASGSVPAEIWLGADSLSPADFLATTAAAIDAIAAAGAVPASVERRTGRVTAERYVAADTPELWGWPIFPEGFHAPAIMAHAKLQAWTLKPALLRTGARG